MPFADYNCLKLPGSAGDRWEDDFVLLADIFPTGWHAAVLANVKSGDSVAVFGSGPVGLLSAYSALIMGAAEVYVVDRAPERLDRVKSIGAIPVDFTRGDPVRQIKDLRQGNHALQSALKPDEKLKMPGVNCVIDAVGYQARSGQNPDKEDPMQTIQWATQIVIQPAASASSACTSPASPAAWIRTRSRVSSCSPWGNSGRRASPSARDNRR